MCMCVFLCMCVHPRTQRMARQASPIALFVCVRDKERESVWVYSILKNAMEEQAAKCVCACVFAFVCVWKRVRFF